MHTLLGRGPILPLVQTADVALRPTNLGSITPADLGTLDQTASQELRPKRGGIVTAQTSELYPGSPNGSLYATRDPLSHYHMAAYHTDEYLA